MSQIGITTKWKILLESREENDQLEALINIVAIINYEGNEENRKKFFLTVINSEICHYLANLFIYNYGNRINFINKIICHLSEHEKFYKYDFFKIFRSYLRLINTFPLKGEDNEANYRNNILTTVLIIMKRAIKCGVDFNNAKKVPAICLLLTANTTSKANVDAILAMDYIAHVFYIMNTIELSEKDQKYTYQNVIAIIQFIPVTRDFLSHEVYFYTVSNLLHQTLNIISASNHSRHEQLIISIMIEKFLAIMEYVIEVNISTFNHECFCNTFYYLNNSEKLQNKTKLLILNRLFILNGHVLLIDIIKSEASDVKTRVIVAEIIFQLSKMFHNFSDDDKTKSLELKQSMLDVVFKADLNFENHLKQTSEPSGETMTLSIIISYINSQWNLERKRQAEMLSMLAYFLEIIKRRKIKMDNGVFAMLVSLYTTNFINISIKGNQILHTSSATILKYYKKFNVVIDLKFIQWWYQRSAVKPAEYEQLIMHYIETANEDLDKDDLYAFDLSFILKMFLKCTTIRGHRNLAKVISKFSLNTRDYVKIMKLYEACDDPAKSIDLLEIMSINVPKVTPRVKKSTLILMQRVLNEMKNNILERAMAIQLSAITLINLK